MMILPPALLSRLRQPLRRMLHCMIVVPVLLVMACSPDFDWREVRGTNAPYVVLMPAKPTSDSRDIPLDGKPIPLTMTLARADDVSFSVTAGKLPDPAQADRVLASMKQSLLHNTGATVSSESASATSDGARHLAVDGRFKVGQGSADTRLSARFVARDGFVYQVVAYGPADKLTQEVLDTFLTSFKPG